MKIVLEYIRQMKEMKVFDISTFVIMADHGKPNTIGSRPLLCIKRPQDSFSMNVSNKPISFAQFLPMILNQADNGIIKYVSYPNIRAFYLQKERDFIEYQIEGNARDIRLWKKGRNLGSWYKKQRNLYTLGEKIDCSDKNMYFETFQGKGWYARPHSNGTLTVGPETDMILKLRDYKNQNLKLSFSAVAYLQGLSSRTLKIYANKTLVKELCLDNKTHFFSVKIPSSLLTGTDLLRISFCIDHADAALKNGLTNAWGFLMEWFKVEEVNAESV